MADSGTGGGTRGSSRMLGRVAVVTGGNAGIGKETAAALAAMGATVVLTARDPARGAAALAEIRARTGSDRVEIAHLDLADLASVRACADDLLHRHERLDVLVNNAGLTLSKRRETRDGFETTFGVNHLGHFLLTTLLLDRLRAGAPSRVVVVSSGGHKLARRGLAFDDLQWERRRYQGFLAYAHSKLANLLFTRELARRLEGTGVTANAVHPGFVRSDFGLHGDTSGPFALGVRCSRPFGKSSRRGAETSVYLASSPDVEGTTGGYFSGCRPARPSRAALDEAAARRLWEVSERLVAGRGTAGRTRDDTAGTGGERGSR